MDAKHELQVALERHLAAAENGEPGALREFLRVAKTTGPAEALPYLRSAVVPGLDYTGAQALARLQRQWRAAAPPRKPDTRLAILGSVTSEQLAQAVDLFLFGWNLAADLYESHYGIFRQEILDPSSGLHAFRPQILFLATGWRDLGNVPRLNDDDDAVRRAVDAEFAAWSRLWQTAHERLGCQLVQNNFDAPPWRALDNHEPRQAGSFGRFVSLLNQAFAERAPAYVTIHDLDHLAACAGRWRWADERFFHHAKLPCAPECLVDYAHSVASLVAAQSGVGKKCLVLDLDNTLWGGVIGDDGLGGIRLGQGDGEGEAYLSFQRYVHSLRTRGVILAVCSKNEDHIAREVFEKHAEMVLRLDDISCFVANWTDKATNLRTIAQRLNIGLNALVFVDDNPVERAIVRQLVPEVAVPELPADPAGYVRALAKHRFFQVVSVNAEDLQRTEMYKANAARDEAEASSGTVEDFLRSLEMTARTAPVDTANLERTVQLIGRSNQFNLTTRRYSNADIVAKLDDPAWITRTVSLADRFGDNGLICVLLARIDGGALEIDTWLMSCRVLKRGVEDFLLNHLVALARARGVHTLRAEYIPTSKNGLVREHYRHLGFTQVKAEADGHTWWELDVANGWAERQVFIKEVGANG